jgi:hypothetical protein
MVARTGSVSKTNTDDSGPGSFHAIFRGMKQRLPNGNTLIVDPEAGRLLEVTATKDVAWECFCVPPSTSETGERRPRITSAQRYAADELSFLKGAARVRP